MGHRRRGPRISSELWDSDGDPYSFVRFEFPFLGSVDLAMAMARPSGPERLLQYESAHRRAGGAHENLRREGSICALQWSVRDT